MIARHRNCRCITKNYKRGLITEEERYKEVVETWKADDDDAYKGTS